MTGSAEDLAPFVDMAMGVLTRQYPYHLTVVMQRDEDAAPPRLRTPAFAGAFDWHSAVHGHWCLVRAVRLHPDAAGAAAARTLLDGSLREAHLAAELAHLSAPGHEGFERPYGLAWLLQLAAEVRAWEDASAARIGRGLEPLESLAAKRLTLWLDRLRVPVRSGEHSQSAFALGLLLDWARDAGQGELARRLGEQCVRLYAADRDAPIAYEPSAHDFLSPILAEADLLRRALEPGDFQGWFDRFVPGLSSPAARRWLTPVEPVERSDGKFAHFDGLNLSRAWMLEGIVVSLPAAHPARELLARAAAAHRAVGLAGARGGDYMGTHWLGSFAVYLLTGRGLGPPR